MRRDCVCAQIIIAFVVFSRFWGKNCNLRWAFCILNAFYVEHVAEQSYNRVYLCIHEQMISQRANFSLVATLWFVQRKNGDLDAARNQITTLLFGTMQSMTGLFADTLKQCGCKQMVTRIDRCSVPCCSSEKGEWPMVKRTPLFGRHDDTVLHGRG